MKMNHLLNQLIVLALISLLGPGMLLAQESAEDLAKKLANPVASLISVPFQGNYDGDIGPTDDGERWTLNIQPVIPISLNEEWNLISRTILPVEDQQYISATLSSLHNS